MTDEHILYREGNKGISQAKTPVGDIPPPNRPKKRGQQTLVPMDQFLDKEIERSKSLLDELVNWVYIYRDKDHLKDELPSSIRCFWKQCEGRMIVEDMANFPHWKCWKCGAIINLDHPGG